MEIGSCRKILDIKAHSDVFTACEEFEARWKEIGLKLGIRTAKLDAIDLNERECGRCMFQMLAVWLRRSEEQIYPTWRGLCLAIASVDRIAAQRIAREHPCDCSYCTGIDPVEEEKLMFLPQMCECGKCTVTDWMKGRLCLQRSKECFPKFILLQQPSPQLSALLKYNFDDHVTLQAQTEKVIEKYKSCSFSTMEKLYREVNGYWICRQRWIPLAIDEIVGLLRNSLGFPVPQQIVSFHQLENYLQSIRVSWFNFKPIALISKVYLNGLYPELHKEWIKYFHLFHEYCYQRNLKDCARILFNSENDNTFILQVDETYYDMKLSDISCLRDSLCYVLGCNKLSVHLLGVSRGSLLLVFCYCFEDYLSRFQLTSEQLICLADLKICRILSLKDIRSRFVYPNIQNYKIIPHKMGIRETEHTSQALQFVQKSIIELHNLDVTESLLQGAFQTVLNLKKLPVIDTLCLEVTERQFRLLHPVSSETQKTDMSKTELHVGKEDISPDKYEIQHEEFSSMTVQESDSIQHGLNSISIYEVANFFSLYDLHVTEQQKIKLLSSVSTSDTRDFRFPVGMNPSKLLINDIESLQKGMDLKEAELSREREQIQIYKKKELGMKLELQAKEMQIKKYQTIVGDSDEALYSKEVFPEATDEHKGENVDRVEILLEESQKQIVISKDSEINELKIELQKQKDKIEQLKSKLTSEKKKLKEIESNLVTLGVSDEILHSKEVFPEATDEHMQGEDSDNVDKVDKIKILPEGMDAKEAKLNRERNQADIFKKMSLGMIQELHAKEMQIKKLNIETHPELSVGVSDEALHSNEVFPEATDEHKGEDSDNVDKVDEVKRLQEDPRYAVKRFGRRLSKDVYSTRPDIPSNYWLWPRLSGTRFVTLALITNQSVTRDDAFTHQSLRNSEDDISRYKVEIAYDEVFPKVLRDSQFKILVSGRPGIGKTVLLSKVCKDWANKECLSNVDALIHVPLRELHGKCARPTLADILEIYCADQSTIHDLSRSIEHLAGEGICFALDGLDEYPNLYSPGDLITGLITNRILPQASVIVTSRPVASEKVKERMNTHVEIIGFMPTQIEKYITDYYESQQHLAKKLLAYIDTHPNVKDMCYLPLHLAMIVHLNQVSRFQNLPETESEIYHRFVSHSVIRYVVKERGGDDDVYIETFSDMRKFLSAEEYELFQTISCLALYAKIQSRIIFSVQDIENHFPTKFTHKQLKNLENNGLGIVSSYRMYSDFGQKRFLSFQHLTFQEFLGAYHLSTLDIDHQKMMLERHGNNPSMREVWKFFFGIIKSIDSAPLLYDNLAQLNPAKGVETLFLCRCAFETQGEDCSQELCRQLLSSRECQKMDISNVVLSSPDCSAIGFVLYNSPLEVKQLLMNYCQVGVEGIEALKAQLSKCPIEFENISNFQIRSQINPLGEKGAMALKSILSKMPKLLELRLYGNQLRSEKLAIIEPVICSMRDLRVLVLTKNDLGPGSGKILCSLTVNFPNLIQFYVSYNPIGTKGLEDALPGLLKCTELKRLGLRGCNLDKNAGRLLSTILFNLRNLEQLELYLNHLGDGGIIAMCDSLTQAPKLEQFSVTKNDMGDKGGSQLAEVVKKSFSLKQIRLYYNNVTYITRQAFYKAAREREQKGLESINYAV